MDLEAAAGMDGGVALYDDADSAMDEAEQHLLALTGGSQAKEADRKAADPAEGFAVALEKIDGSLTRHFNALQLRSLAPYAKAVELQRMQI